MADPREGKGGSEVGYFYYDWELSRYRWKNKHSSSKGDAVPSKGVVAGVRAVKEFAKDDLEHSVPKENERKRNDFAGEMKKPLQDRDINLQISLSRRRSEDNIIAQMLPNQVSVLKKDCSNASHSSCEAQEVGKGHGTMIKVLQTRLLRLRAAQTLWHKDTNAFIEYLLRLKDDAVLVDVMPFLTSRVREVSPEGQALSMGACLEMLPALERLLTSKFEDYIISGLNMTREMIKRWWLQLKAATNKGVDPELYRCSRSVSGLYMAIISLSSIIVKLTKWKGPVGEKALVVTRLLDLL